MLTGTSLALLALGTSVALRPITAIGGPAHAAAGVLSVCAALLGGVGFGALLAARGLKRRRTSGRGIALGLAIPNLLVVPFGTALGVYTFWVLLNDDARREFGRPPRGALPRAQTPSDTIN